MASGSSNVWFKDLEVSVSYDYTPAVAGRYSGLPEDCYPDEPAELEIESAEIETTGFVVVDGVRTPATVVVDAFQFMDAEDMKKFEEIVYQDIESN